MALRMMEGFDHELNASDANSGIVSFTNASYGFSSSGTRFGAGQLLAIFNTPGTVRMSVPSTTTGFVGFALQMSNLYNTQDLFSLDLYDGTNSSAQITLGINQATGLLTIYRGGYGGTVLGVSTLTFSTRAWNYFELGGTIGTSGSISAFVNGEQFISLTGINTQNTSANTFNAISFNEINSDNYFIDDVYMCDASGSGPDNTFLGDVRVQTLFPSGAGASTQFSPFPTTDANWQAVSETQMDSDTSYNSALTVGFKDKFAVTSISGTASSIVGVQTVYAARKDDSGTRAVASVVNSGTTEVAGTSTNTLTSYQYVKDVFRVDPNTGVAWTQTAVNAMQIGYKVTA